MRCAHFSGVISIQMYTQSERVMWRHSHVKGGACKPAGVHRISTAKCILNLMLMVLRCKSICERYTDWLHSFWLPQTSSYLPLHQNGHGVTRNYIIFHHVVTTLPGAHSCELTHTHTHGISLSTCNCKWSLWLCRNIQNVAYMLVYHFHTSYIFITFVPTLCSPLSCECDTCEGSGPLECCCPTSTRWSPPSLAASAHDTSASEPWFCTLMLQAISEPC